TPFSLNDTTVISFTATADPASKAADRFSLIFKQNNALPASITSIKAYQKNQGIAVEWTAQQEINMDRYEVEKSIDATVFHKVGVLQSKGNAARNSYNWFDANASNGYNYYRIKSIEKSGKEFYTQIVNVAMGKVAISISLYPNPILDNKVNIKLENVPKGYYSIVVTNAIGQQVFTKKLLHNGGSAIETIALDTQLITGNYYLKLLAADGTNWQLQFVKP
ncbi:MAG: T9SS type A sorting domain-containing protein, partial [Chitinophagaceae bacterium]|nr:T9SS type A sorting domain-containing protein [Chitinophagaceae bacterium]